MKTYDPNLVTVVWGAHIVTGLAEDGDAISAVHDEDQASKRVGLTGEVARAMNHNRTGKVTLRLLQTALSNAFFSAAFAQDRLDRSAAYPLLIKDLSGTTLFFTSSAWIMKPADLTFGKDVGTREWTFDTAQIDLFIGGTDA